MRWAFHRPDKPRLVLDVETYSEVELALAGPHAYAEHPSTGVHCLAWELKGGHHPGKGLWLPGDLIPGTVYEHIVKGLGPVIAHNWLFEWCIYQRVLGPRHGWPMTTMEDWSCTMARALYHGLPAGLELLGEALELDNPKDKSARQNMLRLARPRTKHTDGTALSWWHEDPARGPDMLKELYAYCRRDVAAESEADDKLPELPDNERRMFLLDAKVNLRGVYVDRKLVDALGEITADELHRIDQVVQLATKGEVKSVNQVGALTQWIATHTGIALPSLAKEHLPAALAATQGTVANILVQARVEGAKASTAKLKAMRTAVSRDGRARLLLQYYGAGRTGRWAGRRVQPQNMPRPLLKGPELEHAIEWALTGHGAGDFAAWFSPSVMGTVSSCLRGCLAAEPDHELVSVDCSQIEARVVAWLAGQRDILEVFARGEDVYTYTARKIGSNDRQLGKVLVLACVGENVPVLTDSGWKPIQTVTLQDRVWDGLEWVSHKGLVARGQRETWNISGAQLTPDHLVLCGTSWLPAKSLAQDESTLSLALVTATGSWLSPGLSLGSVADYPRARSSAGVVRRSISWFSTRCGMGARFAACGVRAVSRSLRAKCIGVTRALFRTMSTAAGCSTGLPLSSADARTLSSGGGRITAAEASRFMSLGPAIGRLSSTILSGCRAGIGRSWKSTVWTIRADMSPVILPSARAGKTCSTAARSSNSKRRLPTYDIAYCGPRNRFTILTDRGPLIVHNCGFGMGGPKFAHTAGTYGIALDEHTAQHLVWDWRAANPAIVQLWSDLGEAFKRTVRAPSGTWERLGRLQIGKTGKAVRIRLPSGRDLVYQAADIGQDEKGRDELGYWGVHQLTNKWTRLRTYGGKLVENLVQATARDVLGEAILACEAAGLRTILTVHDEGVFESPRTRAYRDLQTALTAFRTPPAWADGLPVGAAGWVGARYQKG